MAGLETAAIGAAYLHATGTAFHRGNLALCTTSLASEAAIASGSA